MWSPTHVQVTVHRARNLRTKGRNSTNDAFVLIQMGKEKFQTSVKEKCVDPSWLEECDLVLNQKDSSLSLTVFHRNLLGLDEFLGCVLISLKEVTQEKRVFKWFPLKGKSGKNEDKYRGELQVSLVFVVRSFDTQSLNEFGSAKHRKVPSFKSIASSVGHKIQKLPSKTLALRQDILDSPGRLMRLREKRHSIANHQSFDSANKVAEDNSIDMPDYRPIKPARKHNSIYSSTLSLPQSAMITTSIQEVDSLELENVGKGDIDFSTGEFVECTVKQEPVAKEVMKEPNIMDFPEKRAQNHGEWSNRISYLMKDLTKSELNLSNSSRSDCSSPKEKKNTLISIKNSLRRHTLQLSDAPDLSALKIISNLKKSQAESKKNSLTQTKEGLMELSKEFPPEVISEYEKRSHQELVALAVRKQAEVEKLQDKVADLENYLDNLLVRVMETTPRILQTPYKTFNPACAR